ncbi:SPOR domain-containing protein [Rhodovulum sp. P5]|uniref:SPOR domain-containing protein n=1 Tax=Rhodovulum sp. P5 TaxID=1564506 RepID=UPI00155FD8EA|nr:SPOR domain-containing protein [Rhodovulum sp. P5]
MSAPADLPPPGFLGVQFVDSRGCVFVRGDVGGWQPRLSRDGVPLCGFRPSFAAAPDRRVPLVLESPPEVPARPAAANRPVPTEPKDTTAGPRGPWDLPTPPTWSALPGPGSLQSLRQPRAPGPGGGDDWLAPRRKLEPRDGMLPAEKGAVDAGADAAAAAFTPPQTDQSPPPADVAKTVTEAPAPVVEEKKPLHPASHRYIQVGAFGVPANAARLAARLEALGLPVYREEAAGRGGGLTFVSVGPFYAQEDLDAARNALRGAGFRDVILKN